MAELLILSLGSNLGDRAFALHQAIGNLRSEVGNLLGVSPVYETEPYAVGNHPSYLNLVAAFSSTLDPDTILAITQKIELQSGRLSKGDLSPRRIDIDLISYGENRIQHEKLVLPHPRMHLRKFVLIPLLDVCPDWKNPSTGDPLRDLISNCTDSSWVKKNSFFIF
jgi:2-amino-4-hydroxy-6-hydroxymethyldihydropteridine diphosphokinase